MRQIVQSSDQLKSEADKPKKSIKPKKYPFDQLQIGQSFVVAHDEIKLSVLKAYASRLGIKYGRRFAVYDHGVAVGYEVGCVGTRNVVREELTEDQKRMIYEQSKHMKEGEVNEQ